MHRHTEVLLNARDEFGYRQRRRRRPLLEHEIENWRRKFVGSARTAFAGNQARKALLGHCLPGLIERGA
jgi:hypothetical protein